MMTGRLLTIVGCLWLATAVQAAPKLFKNGKSSYKIVLAEGASASEQTAARELQDYLRQVGGVELPVTTAPNTKGRYIYIGYDRHVQAVTGAAERAADDESFTYQTHRGNLYIYGGRQRGTMYGVFTFLERELGVRWYTPDCTVVPRQTVYELHEMNISESPAIRYRYAQYWHVAQDAAWCAHNKNNSLWKAADNEYGGIVAYWNAHTMGQFMPVREFFADHPEYFALRDGHRIDNGQLCLSNPDVLRICTDRLLKAIADNPGYWVYSLSQNDNTRYCQCEACTAIAHRYGDSQSGLMLWFVNQAAEKVHEQYPHVMVGTFAYQYTRKPPVGIQPADNVVVRLCSIECCFAHPFSYCGGDFMRDLSDWSKIAPHLFIWDYVVDFAQYQAPFPNLHVLAENIRILRDNHAIGIQEEAQYQGNGGEFCELKAWLLTRLLWNPEQDTDALVSEFVHAYYGAAAEAVMEYIAMCRNLIKPDTYMGIFIRHDNPLFTDRFVGESLRLLNAARKLVEGDATLTKRIDNVRLQPLYLYLMRQPKEAAADGSAKEYLDMIERERYRVDEWNSLDKFINDHR